MEQLNKYQEGKIYKIICDDFDKIYIGSTVQKLYVRFARHKELDTAAKELFKYPNVRIELIERFPCNSKDELRIREQYHINENKDQCINIFYAYISKEDANEKHKLYKKQWMQDNHARIYEQCICECGSSYSKKHYERHKTSRLHNKRMNQINNQL
jgi:hypothetical protein